MITLTGKETKLELQTILDDNKIQYSKLDNKDTLIEKIQVLNKVKEVSGEDKKENETWERVFKDEEIESKIEEITGSQYCNIKGHNKRTKFHIEKKFKQEKYSSEEWKRIFEQEKL
jgi:hypothetical protein